MCFSMILSSFSQFFRPQIGLGVSSAQLLALPNFLASAVSAREALEQQFGEEFAVKELVCVLEELYAVTGNLGVPDN